MQKFINKTNIGIISTLLLLITLSQTNILNYFLNTCLGRTILILIILLISYTNKILGVVAILFIIIMFNVKMAKYRENMTNSDNNLDANSSPTNSSPTNSSPTSNLPDIKNINVVSNGKNKPKLDISSITPETVDLENTNTSISESNNLPSIKLGEPIESLQNSENLLTSTEGFDILGTENQLKRGKQSNSIMVGDYMRQSSNVIPYESDKLSYLSPT